MTALPKLEDWKAPWETTKEGKDVSEEEQKIEPSRLKKYLYGLLSDKERLQTSVTTVTEDRDKLKKDAEELARKDETAADKLKRENEELTAKLAKGTEDSAEKRALRLEVAIDKGLTLIQAERLLGATKEEMAADADKLVESFGGSGKGEEEDSGSPSRQPRRLHSAGDPDPAAGAEVSYEQALDSIPRL